MTSEPSPLEQKLKSQLMLIANKYKDLEATLNSRDEEILHLKQKNRNLEAKLDDYYKNNATANFSDISQLKQGYEKETLIMKELNKSYKKGFDEKSEAVIQLTKEINQIKINLEEERKKNLDFMNITLKKMDRSSQEIQSFNIQKENTSLKTELSKTEERLEQSLEQVELLTSQNLNLKQTLKLSIENIEREYNHKKQSYKQLISDYQKTNETLINTQDELEKAKFMLNKYENDTCDFYKKTRNLEINNLELNSVVEQLNIRGKNYNIDLEGQREKILEYENLLAEYKLGKQMFDVKYSYMGVEFTGRFVFAKDGDNFQFTIENRTNSRIFSFFDIEIAIDPTETFKFSIKFLKEDKSEIYTSQEADKIEEVFNDFRKRAIEVADFTNSSGTTTLKQSQSDKVEKAKIKENLNSLFDF